MNNPNINLETSAVDDVLEVKVKAESVVDPLLGIGFQVLFEPEKIFYLDYSAGSFFEKSGSPIYLVKESDFGKITFGASMKNDDTLPVGEGEIVSFKFLIQEEGETEIEFSNGVLASFDGNWKIVENVNWNDSKVDLTLDRPEVMVEEIKMDRQMDSRREWWSVEFVILMGILAAIVGYLAWRVSLKRRSK